MVYIGLKRLELLFNTKENKELTKIKYTYSKVLEKYID